MRLYQWRNYVHSYRVTFSKLTFRKHKIIWCRNRDYCHLPCHFRLYTHCILNSSLSVPRIINLNFSLIRCLVRLLVQLWVSYSFFTLLSCIASTIVFGLFCFLHILLLYMSIKLRHLHWDTGTYIGQPPCTRACSSPPPPPPLPPCNVALSGVESRVITQHCMWIVCNLVWNLISRDKFGQKVMCYK